MKVTLRIATLLILNLVVILTISAQQDNSHKPASTKVPNLSGTWVLDKTRSGQSPGVKGEFVDVILTIVQQEPEVKIKKTIKHGNMQSIEERVYRTDGRETAGNQPGIGNQQYVTRWEGKKLVTTVSVKLTGPNVPKQSAEMFMREQWELSNDGRKLTQSIVGSGLPNMKEPQHIKFVFRKTS